MPKSSSPSPDERPVPEQPGAPEGDVTDWFRRGEQLFDKGSYAAAAQLLSHANEAAPNTPSIMEVLARAYFNQHLYEPAQELFAALVEVDPVNDYARFGWGLCLSRLNRFPEAQQQLLLARSMNPQRDEYQNALTHVQATLRARENSCPANQSGAQTPHNRGGNSAPPPTQRR